MENNDSVAFIAKIKEIYPIPNADNIELVKINGWTSVVQKGIHKIDDLVLCLTTDAVIPEELGTKWGVINYLRKGNRVRTVRLKGSYSECILIPKCDIFINSEDKYNSNMISEGDDLMKLSGIYKYEPPIREEQLPGGKKIRFSQNPNFHVYYKFPNAKNVPNMFNESDQVVVTRKIHGSNARYGIVKKTKISVLDHLKKFFGFKFAYYEYVYGSHNVQKADDSEGYYATNHWKEVDHKYDIKGKLWQLFKDQIDHLDKFENIIIYGEIYGKGIQGDKYNYGLDHVDLVLFDVEIDGKYMDNSYKLHLFSKLNIFPVETLYTGPYNSQLLTKWNNDLMENEIPHEGVVISCPSGDRSKIMKVVSPLYTMASEKYNIPDSH